ncbi:MAG TPA: FtsX-like permease family protein, partial [Anaerolineales bacterium]
MSLLRPSLIKAGLRDLVRRPVQTALMVLGVALGVAVVLAIDLANASARRGFELSTEAVIGRATHRIEGGPTGLDEQLYFDLRAAGFRASAPVIEGWVVASEFDNQPLRILGLDPLAEALFRNLFPGDTSARPGFERFYTHSDQVIIGEGLAQRLSLTPGDSLKISTERRLSLTVLGVVSASSEADRRLFSDLLLMDLAAAQEVLDQVGRLTRIDLILTPGELSRLEDRLPPGVVLSTASEQAETAAQLTSAFQLNLTALSLLALVVGMFLIYNTVTFSVVQRREVFGTLRALGVTADELIVQITTEAIVVAGLGALIGVGLGWLMGQSAVRLVTQTINDLYFVSSVREAQLGPWSVLKAVALGVGAGALAALGPAWEAARVPPITALQRSSLEIRTRALAPRLALIGLGLIAIGSLALLLIQRLLALNLAAILVLLVGLALMVPLATIVAMRIVGPLLEAVFGVIGRMAARTVITALSRTSIAIAALMVALSVTIGVGLMIASFRNTVENWLDLTVRADVYVAPLTNSSVQSRLTFSPTWAERLKDIPGV